MWFDSRKVTELEGLNYKQRMQAIRLAYTKSEIWHKAALNLSKFALLAPVFFWIARHQDWSSFGLALVTFFLYPILTKPITIFFVRPQLESAVKDVLANELEQ